jgi:hypothetical protein
VNTEPVARGEVALGVVGEAGVDAAAGHRDDAVRPRLARRGVVVGADIGLEGEIADGVVGEG